MQSSWNSWQHLRAFYGFLHRELLPERPDLFLELADPSSSTEAGSTEASELFLDVYEHLFLSPTETQRSAWLQSRPYQRVLDFGAGTGFYGIQLAQQGVEVSCIEPNELKCQFLARTAESLGVSDRIDFSPSGTYDAVLCINVLDHVPDASLLVPELADYLVPGGELVTYAHFTADGVHVSDPDIIDRTFAVLDRGFLRAPPEQQPGTALEIWIKRQTGSARADAILCPWPLAVLAEQLRELHPMRHPDLVLNAQPDGSVIASGDRFYLSAARMSESVGELLACCDGGSCAMDAYTGVFDECDPKDAAQVFLELWRRRYIWMHFADPAVDRS